MLIAGEDRPAPGKDAPASEVVDVLDPFSEKVVARVWEATSEDVDRAARAARSALPEWRARGGAGRAKLLEALADAIEARKAELSVLETRDCGKPVPESEWDLEDCAACLRYYAGLARELDGERGARSVDVGDADYACHIRMESAGVVGAIVPWNYPALMAIWKLGPALAAGCTVLLKPSELTPLSALELARMAHQAGFPAGVLNVLTGTGAVGEMIVRHPGVDVVAFTGSVPTGVKVALAAAPGVKQVSLELGGKSAAVVFPDADLDKAAEWVIFGCMWTNGQICTATSRLLVHEEIAEAFLERLVTIAKGINMGDPQQQDCRLGPLVSKAQQTKVLGFVKEGVRQGARLVLGSEDAPARRGFFVAPTILRLDSPDNVVWREEIFGPVLSVMTFKDDADALARANDAKYGLAAAVFSRDTSRLERFSRDLEVGIVWINCSQPCFCQLPWGGRKLSGFGRDLGEFGLNKFLEPKQVVKYVSSSPLDWYPSASKL